MVSMTARRKLPMLFGDVLCSMREQRIPIVAIVEIERNALVADG
jgi:hypothetical protein